MDNDRFGGNVEKLEMSRYIDLDIYHAVERTHPYYMEMIAEILDRVREFDQDGRELRVWEFGAGTGLATEELIRIDNLRIDAVDLDKECCMVLERHIGPKAGDRVTFACDDALTFGEAETYDLTVSVFAHDHIPPEKAGDLAANIRRVLKPGGHYVIGGEMLPYYETEQEWRDALYKYHCFIINKAMYDEDFEVAQIEINALKSGLYRIGDFKRHEAAFEKDVLDQGFRIASKCKLGPSDIDDVGGVFVYDFEVV